MKLDNECILDYSESIITKDYLILLSAFSEEGSLQYYISIMQEQKSYLDEPQIWNYLGQITYALIHAHSRKVLHLNLKSDNILIVDDIVKLTGFGASNFAQSEQ